MLQNPARQQNTLGCQQGMLFPSENLNLSSGGNIFCVRFKSRPASDLPVGPAAVKKFYLKRYQFKFYCYSN